jgi:LmbE family N-acetylglucosaminyl deacetylase
MAARVYAPTIVAVFAHPDDESLACGATLACLADLGWNVVLICASRGERGGVVEPDALPDIELGRLRGRELDAASRVLGVRAVHLLQHPDGNLRWGDARRLGDDILALLSRHRPKAVITFDDDGLYWHDDHLAVHERTSNAVFALGADAPALYYVTMPPGAMRRVVERASERQWTRPLAGVWSIDPSAFGVAAKVPTITLDVRRWVTRKIAALQCHRSQLGLVNPFSLLDAAEAAAWLGFEYFRRAPNPSQRPDVLEPAAELGAWLHYRLGGH